MKKLLSIIIGAMVIGGGTAGIANASQDYNCYESEFGVCCSEQIEVEITPSDLVTGAYQGMYKEHGIPSAGLFLSEVRRGDITAEDLVRAAFFEYRATYEDMMGETDLIDKVQTQLDLFVRVN